MDKTYLIAIPCMDIMPTPTVASLIGLKRIGKSRFSFLSNSTVYNARNMLAKEAIETGADRVLWIDSDMAFNPDLMERLATDMDEHNLDYVSGIYFKRQLPMQPLIYSEVEFVKEDGATKSKTCQFVDYPCNSLFETAGSGFGAVMTSTKLLVDVGKRFGAPFLPFVGMLGEDLSFCWKARQCGYKLWCDSRVSVGHVGWYTYNEDDIVPQK